MSDLEQITTTIADLAWGPWLLVLLIGGGLYFLARSRFTPYRHIGHALALVAGKYDLPDDPGHVPHRQALATALAGTIGMGNIAGVAIAIQLAGPGAIFWMWLTAIVGMATKFFTCTLAVMYRGKDSEGTLQGGPMYVIREALPRNFHFLAYFFAFVGLIGCLPALQTNQLIQALRDLFFIKQGFLGATEDPFMFNLSTGIFFGLLTALIIFGGLLRIARVTASLVPFMSGLYVVSALVAIVLNIDAVPGVFALIIQDAFTGEAVAGGSILAVILYGVRRGAYSNEAGIGTESMAHATAKTREPVREGLVAMLGPLADTLIVCTMTAVMILLAGNGHGESEGVTMTAQAFGILLGPLGEWIVLIVVVCFAATTIFTYSFYGSQCASFLFGVQRAQWYRWLFVGFICIAGTISMNTAVNLIDACFALMAIPTMVSAIWLAPQVTAAARTYWTQFQESNS